MEFLSSRKVPVGDASIFSSRREAGDLATWLYAVIDTKLERGCPALLSLDRARRSHIARKIAGSAVLKVVSPKPCVC